MTVKSVHTDKYGDQMEIYRSEQDNIFIDCFLDDDEDASWRGVCSPAQARQIAKRLMALADIIEASDD